MSAIFFSLRSMPKLLTLFSFQNDFCRVKPYLILKILKAKRVKIKSQKKGSIKKKLTPFSYLLKPIDKEKSPV